MNYKIKTFIAFCFLISLIGKAQVVDFYKTGSLWTYFSTETSYQGAPYQRTITEKDSIVGDTTINTLTYKKILCKKQIAYHTSNYTGYAPIEFKNYYLRYDTIAKKQYIIDTAFSSTENLFLDFNLTIGDTVPCLLNYMIPDVGIIDSIENITVFGKSLKKFHLGMFDNNYALEGIGGSGGLHEFKPVFAAISPGIFMTELSCFNSNDSSFSVVGNCPYLVFTGIEELQHKNMFTIFPNPTTHAFKISSNFNVTCIIINNLLGESVFSQKSLNRNEINIDLSQSIIHTGIYIIHIIDDKGNNGFQKLIVE
jgi:Secretion system C-terminal sorting domain